MYSRTAPLSEKSPLEAYLDDLNQINRCLGRDEISQPLSKEEVRFVFNRLQGDLSPESLNCDGEISAHEANVKWNFLQDVFMELEMCDDWGVTYGGVE